jgi:hypothetical protein
MTKSTSFFSRLAEKIEPLMPGATTRAELRHMRRFLDPELTGAQVDEDGIEDVRLAGPLIERMALILAEYCRANNVLDCVEMSLTTKEEPFETFVVTVRNATTGKSPHQLRLDAEAECTRLRKSIEDREVYLVAYVDNNQRPYAAAFSTRERAEEWAAAVDGTLVDTAIDRHAKRKSG